MPDDQLLQDLAGVEEPEPFITQILSQHHISTYRQLFELVRDDATDPELRKIACDALEEVYSVVDHEHAVPVLLSALCSPHSNVRGAAAFALGHSGNQRAVHPLVEIALDKNKIEDVREWAIFALARTCAPEAMDTLLKIACGLTESPELRSHALEHSTTIPTANYSNSIDTFSRSRFSHQE